jgi:hypothetical protein
MTARGLSGVFPMTAREELKRAQAVQAAAQAALDAARLTSEKGRRLVEEFARQAEDYASAEMRSSTLLADRMKDALKKGEAPAFTNDRELSKNATSLAHLETRRHAAEAALADLVAEEREREREASNATATVEQVVQDVLRAEAEKIAASWEEVELKARAIRIKLGGRSGDPIWRVSGLSDRVGRALYQNGEDSEFDRPQSEIARGPWTDFAAALLRDSDAELDFAAADRAIEEVRKERAEHRAADERFHTRMQGAAA